MSSHRKSEGIAIVAVLISAVVFLGIIIAITGTLSLSSRQSTGDQRATLEAQYAAESGLSRVSAEAQTGLLRTWSQLIFRMGTPNTTSTSDIQRLAKRFCNYTDATALPVAPTATLYCTANNAANISNRYSVFSDQIPFTAYTDTTITPAPTTAPTTAAQAEAFWQDVFSDGPSGMRYSSSLGGGVGYNATFGLEPQRVEIVDSTNYVFVFKVRDSVSTGRYNVGTREVSNRRTTRSFPDSYRIKLSPPNFAYYLSITDKQVVAGSGGNNTKVFFNSSTLLDGPVFTNGAFYYTGNPWLSNTVKSAGCLDSYDSTTKACVGSTATAYYNDGGADQAVTVAGSNAQFSGYATGAPATLTAPEFVNDNFDANSNRTTYTKGASPSPWNYNGNYGVKAIPFPTTNNDQKAKAIASGIYVPVPGGVPAVNEFYDSPAPSVLLQATTTGRTTATSFNTVPNNGTAATGQLIRFQAKQKISRCNAAPTGISINPLTPSINTLSSQLFTATANGPTTPTFAAAPVAQDFTWSVVSVPAGVTGSFAQSGTGNINGTYTSTAGATPTGQYVILRATGPGGIATGVPGSPDAQLSINGIAPNIGAVSADSTVPYKKPSASATVVWPTATGTPLITYELLKSTNTTFSSPTAQTVTSSPTVVAIDTSVNGAKTYYKVKATGPTAPASTSPNYVTVTVVAQKPTVSTPSNFTSSNTNYNAGTRVMPYTGGLLNFDFTVNNTTSISPSSGVGDGPFTYNVQYRVNGGSYSAVPAANVSGSSVVNFSLPRNVSAGAQLYEFQARATATDTALTGNYSALNNPKITVSSIIDPTTTLNTPNPSTDLDFGGGFATLSWSTPTALNTPGPFKYQVQQSIGGGAWTNVGGALNGSITAPVNPTVTTDYRIVTTDQTIAAIPLTGRDTYSNVQTVTVKPLDLPIIDSFTADINPVAVNTATPLRWNVRNAATINVSRIVPTFASLSNNNYTPNGSTITNSTSSLPIAAPFADFQLTATNAVGTVNRIIRVYAGAGGPGLPVPPTNVSLTAFPTEIYYPNSTSTLSWAATNAVTSVITQSPTNVPIAGGVLTAGGGSRGVTLTSTTTYTLTASNAGGSVVRNATVTVNPPANPTVSVTAVNPSPVSPLTSSQFAFAGGTASISWSVTNQAAGGSSSGSGSGPYTYAVYETVNGTENPTPIYTGTNTFTTRGQAANNGTSDVVRSYRVVATNTATSLPGSSSSSSLTVLQAQNPSVALSGNGPFAYPSGTASLTSSGVPSSGTGSTVVAGSGPYSYVLKTESVYNSGTFDTTLSTTSTPPNPFTQLLTNTGSTALVRRYQLTATNTATGRSGPSNIVSVQVNAPSAPAITAISASPTLITNQSGGNSTISWTVDTSASKPISSLTVTGPNSYSANIPVVNGQANYTKSVPINIPGYGAKAYTVTATGPGGSVSPGVNVDFKPLEVLTALNANGSAISKIEQSGVVTPGWQAQPQWTTDHLGGTPAFTGADFSVQVGPAGGPFSANSFEAVSASISATGVITLNVGTLPGARGDQFNYVVRVNFTKNGVTKGPADFTVTVVKATNTGSSLRPRARLTQTCQYGGPVEYAWPVFVEYYIEKNTDGTMTQYKRTYGSTVYNDWVAPATTNEPWSAGTPFNGVMFVDNGVTVSGPPRTTASDPDTAAPAIANFAAMTLASDGVLTVKTDLKYENPVCTTAPVRNSGTGIVTPATCNTTQSNWSRNVLGLYTTSADGIKIKTTAPNTTIQAISMASTSRIEVQDVPQDPNSPGCPTALQPGNNLGSINIQGGLIQKNYGQFGRLNASNTVTCGYGRTMTYDIRMRNPSYQPPAFPAADNAEWTIEFYNGDISDANKLSNITDSTLVFPLRPGFSSNK